jgi:hypothetical protein
VILVVFALLWERHPQLGVALCALSALGWLLAGQLHFFDQVFPWISLANALFVTGATLWVWLRPPEPDPRGAVAPPGRGD